MGLLQWLQFPTSPPIMSIVKLRMEKGERETTPTFDVGVNAGYFTLIIATLFLCPHRTP